MAGIMHQNELVLYSRPVQRGMQTLALGHGHQIVPVALNDQDGRSGCSHISDGAGGFCLAGGLVQRRAQQLGPDILPRINALPGMNRLEIVLHAIDIRRAEKIQYRQRFDGGIGSKIPLLAGQTQKERQMPPADPPPTTIAGIHPVIGRMRQDEIQRRVAILNLRRKQCLRAETIINAGNRVTVPDQIF